MASAYRALYVAAHCILLWTVLVNGDHPNLVVGGSFSIAGKMPAGNIASWNGTHWMPFGAGMSSLVSVLAMHDNMLVAAGSFATADGVPAKSIAQWNGCVWQPLGPTMGEVSPVNSVSDFGEFLIVGGAFTAPASRITQWNGSVWQQLGTGISFGPYVPFVNALNVFLGNNQLVACGQFNQAGNVPVSNIAQWDGSKWSPLGNGLGGGSGICYALANFRGLLVAGGGFTTPGISIATWNGNTWASIGAIYNDPNSPINPYYPGMVRALAAFRDVLIVGGSFKSAGAIAVDSIAQWDGTEWRPVGSGIGVTGTVFALTVFSEQLVVAGAFSSADGMSASNIAWWNGSQWGGLDTGIDCSGEGCRATVYTLQVTTSPTQSLCPTPTSQTPPTSTPSVPAPTTPPSKRRTELKLQSRKTETKLAP